MLHLHHHAEPSGPRLHEQSYWKRGEAFRYRGRQRWDVGQEGTEKERT